MKPTISEASHRSITIVSSRLLSGTEVLYFTLPGTAENGSSDLFKGEVETPTQGSENFWIEKFTTAYYFDENLKIGNGK